MSLFIEMDDLGAQHFFCEVKDMHQIEWNEVNSVGIDSIDEQHKELIAIANRLFQAILDDRGFSILMEVLRELEGYAKTHFAFEEELMKTHYYHPRLFAEHVKEHEALTKQVSDFVDQITSSEDVLDVEIFGFLRDWTDSHLMNTDKQYVDFFRALNFS